MSISILGGQDTAMRKALIAELTEKRDKLNNAIKSEQFNIIRSCEHNHLYVVSKWGAVSYPHSSYEKVICMNCGLQANGANTGRPNNPLLNLTKSVLIGNLPDEEKPQVTYRVSERQQYALSVPRRFTQEYLHELFDDSPFSTIALLAHDEQRYVVNGELIANDSDFSAYYYGDD